MSDMHSSRPLRTVLLGCGGMGTSQARRAAAIDGLDLIAVGDINRESADRLGNEFGIRSYDDPSLLLRETEPEIVLITSHNVSHAPLTLAAAACPSVRAIHCEKPMATNFGDAKAMVEACEAKGILLIINHQRRLLPDLVEARRIIESGEIGEVRQMRGHCQGDFLSDGTHAVDSLLWLNGDVDINWVSGGITLNPEPSAKNDGKESPGFRYGHIVEAGAMGQVHASNNVRLEFVTGCLVPPNRVYQDYEIIGSKGRLWRTGDKVPNLYISDLKAGDHAPGMDSWMYKPVPAEAAALWRQVELSDPGGDGISLSFEKMVHSLETGAPHPMNGRVALRGFEIVMALYESARLRQRINLPLNQDRFPLELIAEASTASSPRAP